MISLQTINIAKSLSNQIGQSVFFYPPMDIDSELQLMLFCCSNLLDFNDQTHKEKGYQALVDNLMNIFSQEYSNESILYKIENSPCGCSIQRLVDGGYHYSLKEFSELYGDFYVEQSVENINGNEGQLLYYFEKNGKKQYVYHSSETCDMSSSEFENNLYRIAVIPMSGPRGSQFFFGLEHDYEKDAKYMIEWYLKERLTEFSELTKEYFMHSSPIILYSLYDSIMNDQFSIGINHDYKYCSSVDEIKKYVTVDEDKFEKLKICLQKLKPLIEKNKQFCRARRIEIF